MRRQRFARVIWKEEGQTVHKTGLSFNLGGAHTHHPSHCNSQRLPGCAALFLITGSSTTSERPRAVRAAQLSPPNSPGGPLASPPWPVVLTAQHVLRCPPSSSPHSLPHPRGSMPHALPWGDRCPAVGLGSFITVFSPLCGGGSALTPPRSPIWPCPPGPLGVPGRRRPWPRWGRDLLQSGLTRRLKASGDEVNISHSSGKLGQTLSPEQTSLWLGGAHAETEIPEA